MFWKTTDHYIKAVSDACVDGILTQDEMRALSKSASGLRLDHNQMREAHAQAIYQIFDRITSPESGLTPNAHRILLNAIQILGLDIRLFPSQFHDRINNGVFIHNANNGDFGHLPKPSPIKLRRNETVFFNMGAELSKELFSPKHQRMIRLNTSGVVLLTSYGVQIVLGPRGNKYNWKNIIPVPGGFFELQRDVTHYLNFGDKNFDSIVEIGYNFAIESGWLIT